MRDIKRIFVHCSAGYGDIKAMQAWWRQLGWKTDGYHYVILEDGTIVPLVPEDQVSNGVQGYNATAINVCYVGGVDKKDYKKALDTRTVEQKCALEHLLTELKEKYPKAEILGHRDISPDKNLNGVVDPWERIKECPSFDAIPEYAHIK